MNYFQAIAARAEQLDELGRKYLDSLPFLPNDEVIQRIFVRAKQIFEEAEEDWEAVPDWVASTMDGWMPYATLPNNGSIYYSLGYSVVAHDAHLRNFLEIAEGRTDQRLDFPCLAEKEKVEEMSKSA